MPPQLGKLLQEQLQVASLSVLEVVAELEVASGLNCGL